MKKITTAGATAVALSVVLVGCSPTTEKNSTATEQSTPTEQSVAARPEGATLHQYIVDNKIAEVPFKKGEAGTPTVDFPFPPGWRAAGVNSMPLTMSPR